MAKSKSKSRGRSRSRSRRKVFISRRSYSRRGYYRQDGKFVKGSYVSGRAFVVGAKKAKKAPSERREAPSTREAQPNFLEMDEKKRREILDKDPKKCLETLEKLWKKESLSKAYGDILKRDIEYLSARFRSEEKNF